MDAKYEKSKAIFISAGQYFPENSNGIALEIRLEIRLLFRNSNHNCGQLKPNTVELVFIFMICKLGDLLPTYIQRHTVYILRSTYTHMHIHILSLYALSTLYVSMYVCATMCMCLHMCVCTYDWTDNLRSIKNLERETKRIINFIVLSLRI